MPWPISRQTTGRCGASTLSALQRFVRNCCTTPAGQKWLPGLRVSSYECCRSNPSGALGLCILAMAAFERGQFVQSLEHINRSVIFSRNGECLVVGESTTWIAESCGRRYEHSSSNSECS